MDSLPLNQPACLTYDRSIEQKLDSDQPEDEAAVVIPTSLVRQNILTQQSQPGAFPIRGCNGDTDSVDMSILTTDVPETILHATMVADATIVENVVTGNYRDVERGLPYTDLDEVYEATLVNNAKDIEDTKPDFPQSLGVLQRFIRNPKMRCWILAVALLLIIGVASASVAGVRHIRSSDQGDSLDTREDISNVSTSSGQSKGPNERIDSSSLVDSSRTSAEVDEDDDDEDDDDDDDQDDAGFVLLTITFTNCMTV